MELASVLSSILSDYRDDPWSIDALRHRLSPLTDSQLSILIKSTRQRLHDNSPEERFRRGEIEAIPEKLPLTYECDQAILSAALVEQERRNRHRADEDYEAELRKYELDEEELKAIQDLAEAEERLKVIETAKASCTRQAEQEIREYEAERLRKEKTTIQYRRSNQKKKWIYMEYTRNVTAVICIFFLIHFLFIAISRVDQQRSLMLFFSAFGATIVLGIVHRKLAYIAFIDTDEEKLVRAIELRTSDLITKWEQAQERHTKAMDDREAAQKAEKKEKRRRAKRQMKRARAIERDNIMKELEEQKRQNEFLLEQADRALNCPTSSSSESEQFSSSSSSDDDDRGDDTPHKPKKKIGSVAKYITNTDMRTALLESEAAEGAIPRYRGVTHISIDRWEARMNEDGQRVSLGFFETAEEAARAYDRSARKHPGWPLNFPEEEAERVRQEAERLLKDETAQKEQLRKEVAEMAALAKCAKPVLYEIDFDVAMERHDVEHAAIAALGIESTREEIDATKSPNKFKGIAANTSVISPTNSARIAPETAATNEALADLALVDDMLNLLGEQNEHNFAELLDQKGDFAPDLEAKAEIDSSIRSRRSDYDEVQFVWEAAHQGDPKAQHALGIMYQKGEGGLQVNDAEAMKWFRKAGDQGYHSSASNGLP